MALNLSSCFQEVMGVYACTTMPDNNYFFIFNISLQFSSFISHKLSQSHIEWKCWSVFCFKCISFLMDSFIHLGSSAYKSEIICQTIARLLVFLELFNCRQKFANDSCISWESHNDFIVAHRFNILKAVWMLILFTKHLVDLCIKITP